MEKKTPGRKKNGASLDEIKKRKYKAGEYYIEFGYRQTVKKLMADYGISERQAEYYIADAKKMISSDLKISEKTYIEKIEENISGLDMLIQKGLKRVDSEGNERQLTAQELRFVMDAMLNKAQLMGVNTNKIEITTNQKMDTSELTDEQLQKLIRGEKI